MDERWGKVAVFILAGLIIGMILFMIFGFKPRKRSSMFGITYGNYPDYTYKTTYIHNVWVVLYGKTKVQVFTNKKEAKKFFNLNRGKRILEVQVDSHRTDVSS